MPVAPVVSFYSYKGGVGRSFTLANVAALLARWQFRVLCIDWDIEAPGLAHYFRPYIGEIAGGLIDLLDGFDRNQPNDWHEHLVPVRIDDAAPIDLLAAGKQDASFVARVQRIEWEALYARGLGSYLEEMRAVAIEEYDFVLIDGRTGITDFNGIVTAQLPDILVFLFTANEQSLDGCIDVVHRALSVRNDMPLDRGRLLLLPIAARFEDRVELEIAQGWRNIFLERLGSLYDPWAQKGIDRLTLLERTTIPYVPYYSFGEKLAVLDPASLSQAVTDVIERIAALLVHRLGRTELMIENRDAFVSAARRAGEAAAFGVKDVFVSYSAPDEAAARALAAALADRRISVFVPSLLTDDADLIRGIGTALDRSKHLVIVVGERSSRSQYDEIHRFVRQAAEEEGLDRSVFPVVLDDPAVIDEMPALVQQVPYISLQRSTLDEVAEKIVRRVQGVPIDVESGWQLREALDEAGTGSGLIFLSRAGADAEIGARIADILRDAGYEVVSQQWDFANSNFMETMHEALSKGARTVALLSPEYVSSSYCRAEWMSALAGDPLNQSKRLLLLRVGETKLSGLLAGLAYWDLVPLLSDHKMLARVVRQAAREGFALDQTPVAGPYWRPPRTVLAAEIQANPDFTGGEFTLDAIDANLSLRRVVVLHGLGGSGKSTVAREYAWRTHERYSVVWWINAESESSIVDGLLRLGAQVAGGLETTTDRRAAARQVLDALPGTFRGRVLLVFDNLGSDELFQTWRPREGADVIVTSRQSMWASEFAAISIDVLTQKDAVQFLLRASGRSDLSREDAAMIADAVGELPLALSHAAAYLKRSRNVTARSYLQRIVYQLTNAPRNADYSRSVFATFHEAIVKAEEEAPGAAAVISFAAFFAGDGIPEELLHQDIKLYPDGLRPVTTADSVIPLDLRSTLAEPSLVDEALGALDRLSLIAFSVETRTFDVHRLVQAAAREFVAESATAWAQAAVAAIDSAFPDVRIETWPACERLLPHARAALAYLPQNIHSTAAADLAARCGAYLAQRAAYVDAEGFFRKAIALAETGYGSRHGNVATLLHELAMLLEQTARFDEAEALLRQALQITQESGDESDVAIVSSSLAQVLATMGRISEAELLLQQALASSEIRGDAVQIARILSDLAQVSSVSGRFEEAERLLRRAIALDEETFGPQHPRVANDLENLANLFARTNRERDALPLMARAHKIAEERFGSDHPRTVAGLFNLAQVVAAIGDNDKAEAMLRRVLASDETIYGPSHPEVSKDLRAVAYLYLNTERFEQAEPFVRRALDITRAIYGPRHPEVANDLISLGAVLAGRGRISEAVEGLEEAVRIRLENFGPDDDRVVGVRDTLAQLRHDVSDVGS